MPATPRLPIAPNPGSSTIADDWQAHRDARRIGAPRVPTPPEIAQNRARSEAIVRAHAAAVRAAERETGYWTR